MNMKGGVGKTTLAVNVAYALAYFHQKNVLLVDSDPQFNATQSLMSDRAYMAHLNDASKGTLRDIFLPRRPGAVNTVTGAARGINKAKMSLASCTCPIYSPGANRGKLDLLPSALHLIEIDTSRRGTERKLKAYLREKATGYDYVIIDCPPTISIFTMAAILASDKYLVPIKPDPLSIVGLPLLERGLRNLRTSRGYRERLIQLGWFSALCADRRQRLCWMSWQTCVQSEKMKYLRSTLAKLPMLPSQSFQESRYSSTSPEQKPRAKYAGLLRSSLSELEGDVSQDNKHRTFLQFIRKIVDVPSGKSKEELRMFRSIASRD